jgi:two-component system, cell cycle sensor histidine kinase and response regulator CckA
MLASFGRHADSRVSLLVGLAAALSAALLFWTLGSVGLAAGLAVGLGICALLFLTAMLRRPGPMANRPEIDWQLVRSMADFETAALAVTDRSGQLRCANHVYQDWFQGDDAPPALIGDPTRAALLSSLAATAWRDGSAQLRRLPRGAVLLDVDVARTGHDEDCLIWCFRASSSFDLVSETQRLLAGPAGERLGEAGVMAVLIGPKGHIRIASPVFVSRATGLKGTALEGRDFPSLFERDVNGAIRFVQEGSAGHPLRLLQIPGDPGNPDSDTLVFAG